jgi:hypothetical protein
MFLRRHWRSKDGKDHTDGSLVETVRPPDNPRQRTLCYLGELNDSAQARWLKTIEVFHQPGESHQLKLFPSDVVPPEDDTTVARVRLEWQALPARQSWQRAREGAYLLQTNLPPGEPAQFWKSDIQLTEAEAAFRALKSELSIRPIFHQLERRAKAHILGAFLGYALWVTLKHLLMRKGSAFSPAKALSLRGTLVSADSVLPTTDGPEIRLRRLTTPNAEQKRLLDEFGIQVPDRLSFDQECSADSAIA